MSIEAKLYGTVQGFHGRPMCCAQKMAACSAEHIKRDGSICQWYRCIVCQRRQRLYFKTSGTLHPNQLPRMAGAIPRRGKH